MGNLRKTVKVKKRGNGLVIPIYHQEAEILEIKEGDIVEVEVEKVGGRD